MLLAWLGLPLDGAGPRARLGRLRPAMSQASGFNVLVVGGSGRVGGSTALWLQKFCVRDGVPLELAIGGRSISSFEKACQRLEGLGMDTTALEFVRMDIDDLDSITSAISGRSLCIHTAGPFQQRERPTLLSACIRAGVPYCDVCDEIILTQNSKALSHLAETACVPAIVSCGIWPGVSALMAAEATSRLGKCNRIDFSFFTAGTGNAGPTIVSATFLLLCQHALTISEGEVAPREPWTERRDVDFGGSVGVRSTWLLDNPDVTTCAEALGVPNVSSRFGTAPQVWNYLFGAMKYLPQSLLGDRDKMQALALFSEPIIRVVDRLVGATNAMRVDAYQVDSDEPILTLRVAHDDLEQCVGQATAAFGLEILKGTVRPGVWYPAELAKEARSHIFDRVREDAIVWEL